MSEKKIFSYIMDYGRGYQVEGECEACDEYNEEENDGD